jgi:hypothetical protein
MPALRVQEDRVLALVVGKHNLFQAELLSLVQEDLARKAEQEKEGGPGALPPCVAATEARDLAHDVVVA